MLPNPAAFGRLILSFHKFNSISYSPNAKTCPPVEFGKSPKIGTREHISELLSVKDADAASSPSFSLALFVRTAILWRRWS